MSKKATSARTATPLFLVSDKHYKTWLNAQSASHKRWLKAAGFNASAHAFCLLPDSEGNVAQVVYGAGEHVDMWSLASLSSALPKGKYTLENAADLSDVTGMYLGYRLGRYQYSEYKKNTPLLAELSAPKGVDKALVARLERSVFLARDMVSAPPNDMIPAAIAQRIKAVGKQHQAKVSVTTGAALEKGYPAVHAVGKASDHAPALVDLRWGNPAHPKVTLVGKGVSFDSGGLDIKPSSGMRLMKKDMGGAAAALAVANAVMDAKLPVCLRLLIPTVENSISGNAMRPSDVINTRAGLTVEVGNTDAEGRLILCDALAEADKETPDLLIDFATLTGAARVALGTDIPAFFTNCDALAEQIHTAAITAADPMWRLPLFSDYARKLQSDIADISNDAGTGYGGAITAALFLKRFVAKTTNWVHIDMMAWNLESRPGRPKGGEAHTVRGIFELIKTQYTK